MAFSADGARLYTASADGSIGLWQRADGSFQRPLHRHGWGINVLARMPGSERLVFGALNGSVAIVDGEKGDSFWSCRQPSARCSRWRCWRSRA